MVESARPERGRMGGRPSTGWVCNSATGLGRRLYRTGGCMGRGSGCSQTCRWSRTGPAGAWGPALSWSGAWYAVGCGPGEAGLDRWTHGYGPAGAWAGDGPGWQAGQTGGGPDRTGESSRPWPVLQRSWTGSADARDWAGGGVGRGWAGLAGWVKREAGRSGPVKTAGLGRLQTEPEPDWISGWELMCVWSVRGIFVWKNGEG